ncbi:MAG: hypothetical protein HKL95_10895 [Phycisphaerae bacterium]|nr:hypothetical protein [Phycisphaerae bacterium]
MKTSATFQLPPHRNRAIVQPGPEDSDIRRETVVQRTSGGQEGQEGQGGTEAISFQR